MDAGAAFLNQLAGLGHADMAKVATAFAAHQCFATPVIAQLFTNALGPRQMNPPAAPDASDLEGKMAGGTYWHDDLAKRAALRKQLEDGTYWPWRCGELNVTEAVLGKLFAARTDKQLPLECKRGVLQYANLAPGPPPALRLVAPGPIGRVAADGQSFQVGKAEFDAWLASLPAADHLAAAKRGLLPPLQVDVPIWPGFLYTELHFFAGWPGCRVYAHKSCLELHGKEEVTVNGQHADAFTLEWGSGLPLTVGMLFDLQNGYVTWKLNRTNGPRVRLGEGWEQGVAIQALRFARHADPDRAVDLVDDFFAMDDEEVEEFFPEYEGHPGVWRCDLIGDAVVPEGLYGHDDEYHTCPGPNCSKCSLALLVERHAASED